jgi:putative endopeptidase
MKKRVWLGAAALTALCISGSVLAQTGGSASGGDLVATPHYGTWGFDLAGEDRSVKPGDDFFEYADGTYVKNIQIPPDRSSYGNFLVLAELSERRVHSILDDAAARASATPTDVNGKIGAFYKSFMDEARVEQLGARPIQADLAAVRNLRSREELAALMGRSNESFFAPVIDVGISPDEKDPNHYAVYMMQSGLGLPDRDYYLLPSFAEKKAVYQAYVAQMLGLAGWPDAQAQAANIVNFETQIAQASWARADLRNPDKTYNPTTVAQLVRSAPGLAWGPFLQNARLSGVSRVIISTNTAVPKIAAIYAATPLETLKAWEAFHVADNAAPLLSTPFVEAHFQFHNKTLNGQPEQRARWKRAVAVVSDGMGEAVGQIYVARYFPPESKAKMQALVADLKTAFAHRIQNLAWMSPQTKAEALNKLSRYTVKIGYPDKWRDYSTLQIRADDLAGNVARSARFEWLRQVNRINKPVDRAEWGMTPQTVNAYNNPVFNEVVFPAAILQPPFFDPNADAAVNYGAIGGVIGHEMTHGFDDEGRKYDASGRLRDWWTPADAKQFDERAARLGKQYDSYEPLPGAHVKGELTMGENIADQGGLSLGLDAYHASLHGRPAPVIAGLTGDQRVFLGWAQVWRGKMRDDARRQQVVVDPHSPEQFRVNGVVRNIDPWYNAFDVKPGDALYLAPDQRAHIW